ncbi:hypothetical protein ACGFYQ_35080 [Streptomyces sp. NPDC048258]|uniref:hypothetical protein n=1 Tax=Streptomyces sp. NPDC048258 TaxID=3365527 RepID=UPI003714FD35
MVQDRFPAAAGGRSARGLATSLPAFFIAFDILQQDMTELLNCPYRNVTAVDPGHPWTGLRLASSWT